jgi:D-alanyl-D-alanine carboxypeptidase (penicillin-binding protein 5/6)
MHAIVRVAVATRKRPTLYALQSSRRPRRLPRLHPVAVIVALVPLVVIGAVAYGLWVLWPLTDTEAGMIPPDQSGFSPLPSDAGSKKTSSPALPAFVTRGARTRPIAGVNVAAGILIDARTGHVLWMRHPHQRRAVASQTKLMTVHLAERSKGRVFRVPRAVRGLAGETLGLVPGTRVRTRDMLAAAIVESANDAAVALAVHRAGSVRRFVALMNKEARRLRLRDTHYSNPSGIVDAGNRSSAWDVAQMARLVLHDHRLARLVGSKVVVSSTGQDYVNTNKLLWTYSGAIGVKTGYTTASGLTLSAAATRHGRTLIAVVLGAYPSEFDSAARLLDWGFRRPTR